MAAQSVTISTAEDSLKKRANEAPKGRAAQVYNALRTTRQPYLDRARRLAKLTIPSLYPEQGSTGATDEELPWTSIGAFLVNNLSAKVVLSMFPAGRPPMKLAQDRRTQVDLVRMEREQPDQAAQLRTEIDQGLSKVEREFVNGMEEDGDRAKLNTASKKMIVGGNHGLKFNAKTGTIQGLSLERYVTRRAPNGDLLEFVVEDPMAWETLAPDIRAIALANGYQPDTTKPIQDSINVYTHGKRSMDSWEVYQEVYSKEVPDTRYTRTDEALEFLFLPWTLLEGEDYGRSYAEDYEADLTTVDGLEQSISEAAAAMARFLQLVNPAGLTSKRAVASARNGDVISGRADDVTTLKADKTGDLQVASSQQDKASQRLGRAFLVTSAVVRDAERVSAREVYEVVSELEEQLGGVYSQQVVTFQLPYVSRKLRYLQRDQRVTPLPMNTVKMTILGGMAALGRNAELQALDAWAKGMSELFGPQALFQALGPAGLREYMKRRGAALGVDTGGLVPSKAEGEQMDQQQQIQALASNPAALEALRQYGTNQTANQTADTRAESAAEVAAIKATPATAPSTPTAQ